MRVVNDLTFSEVFVWALGGLDMLDGLDMLV